MSYTISRRAALGALAATATPDAQKYRIIDPHVHVWKKDPKFPWAKETTRPPDRDATAEMLLDLMKANGVEKTVIIQVIHYRWDNSYLADVLKKYPTYFKGVARVNPESPAAPDDLSRLVEQQSFRGVRISPAGNASGDWIGGPLMPPLWKRCDSLKVPMTVLAPVTRLYDAYGPQRLMWGTDWPLVEAHCGYAKALAIVRDEMKFLNDEDTSWMLSKTIERVWPFS